MLLFFGGGGQEEYGLSGTPPNSAQCVPLTRRNYVQGRTPFITFHLSARGPYGTGRRENPRAAVYPEGKARQGKERKEAGRRNGITCVKRCVLCPADLAPKLIH